MLRKKVTDFCLKSNQSNISKNKPQTLFFIILNSKYSLFAVSLKASITASFDNEEYIYLFLRWCRARDLLRSQSQVTTGGFELQISCIRSSYLKHQALVSYDLVG